MNSLYRSVNLITGIVSVTVGGTMLAASIDFAGISAGGGVIAAIMRVLEWGSGDIVTAIEITVGGMLAIAGVSLLIGRGRAIVVSAGTGICIVSLIGIVFYPMASVTLPPPRALISLGVIGLATMLTGTSLNGFWVQGNS
jgi:hypothetical protein